MDNDEMFGEHWCEQERAAIDSLMRRLTTESRLAIFRQLTSQVFEVAMDATIDKGAGDVVYGRCAPRLARVAFVESFLRCKQEAAPLA